MKKVFYLCIVMLGMSISAHASRIIAFNEITRANVDTTLSVPKGAISPSNEAVMAGAGIMKRSFAVTGVAPTFKNFDILTHSSARTSLKILINTVGAASSTPTICINTPLTSITHTTTGATGISNDGVAGANGLPAGVSATWSSDIITISGTPTASGTFNYSIALTGGSGSVNATGTITVNQFNSVIIGQVLVVAGGGSGAKGRQQLGGAGGGAGGVVFSNAYTLTYGTYSVTVGNGGTSVTSPGIGAVNGNNGGNSVFGTLTAIGGGGGGSDYISSAYFGQNGGSGGGAAISLSGTTATAGSSTQTAQVNETSHYGNGGGRSYSGSTGFPAGGGGGAGNAGYSPNFNGYGDYGGNGGEGVTVSFSSGWPSGYFAGGGGGSGGDAGAGVPGRRNKGVGGSSIGGNGDGADANFVTSGVSNTGSGGGGSSGRPSGAGGSGIVIIQYPGAPIASGGTITQSNGYTIHTFTSSGTFAFSNNGLDIGSNPQTLCQNATVTALTSSLSTAQYTFQWYSNNSANNTGGTIISGATLNSYTPSSAIIGTTYYYVVVTNSSGCSAASNVSGAITITPINTVSAASITPTLCINSVLTSITHTSTGATGIGTATGLPAGITASFANNTITISGTPTASGTFAYSIPVTGGCGTVNATGTITVTTNNVASAASSTPTLCINSVLTSITHTTTGATGIGTTTGLPAGVTASFASNTITISGTPTASGTFNYSIPLTGGCGTVNATGTITVTPNKTVSAASSTPTLCINSVLTSVTHTTTDATGIGTATGLPAGLSAAWASNTITISGTPTASGTFAYSIPVTGDCGTVNATGIITVTTNKTVSAASSTPTLCINSVLTSITHTTTGATGIGTATGLPAGVTASFTSNTITISGTPTASGTFAYSIPVTGGCGTVNATGTIIVNDLPGVYLGSAVNTNAQTVCINQGIGTIYYQFYGTSGGSSGITGVTVSGLPSGISGTYYPSTYSPVLYITGSTNQIGTFPYTITSIGGACNAVSASGTITISPQTVAGAVTGSTTVCSGTNSTTLTLSGQTGDVIKWQSAQLGTFQNAVDINNTTTTLIVSNVTTSTYYRAVVRSGGCGIGNSDAATVTVSPPSVGGTIAGSATVCAGTNSTTLTLSGHTGAITRWESSLDNFATAGTSIANTTTSLTVTNLTTTTFYRAVVTSGACSAANSATATISTNPLPATPTISPGGATSFCAGGSVVLTATAGSSYSWSNGATSQSITVTTTGNYTVQVTNSFGCVSASSLPTTVTVTAQPLWYLDADGDHYYSGVAVPSCTSPGAGFTTSGILGGGDCADGNPAINPGATEICHNNIDDNCNGTDSEGCAPMVVNMTPSYNNTTLVSFSLAIPALGYTYPGTSNIKYRFSVKNETTGVKAPDVIQGSRYITIPAALHLYGATYIIKVSAVINDEVVPFYGNTIRVNGPTVQLITLSSASCGATLATLASTISANGGLNATGYTFRIRLTTDNGPTPTYGFSSSATRFVGANSFAGFPLQYNTSYQVAVHYTFTDPVTSLPVQSGYGTECTVLTPSIPLIGLAAPTCGSQVATMNAGITSSPAAYATGYRFRIRLTSDNGPTPTYYYTLPNASRFSSLVAFQGVTFAYNTQYSIAVEYSILTNSVTQWSGFGSECIVKTPFFPVTSLVPSQCGLTTPTSLTQQLNITPYPGFPNYKVKLDEISGEDVVNSQEIIVTYSNFRLNQFSIAQLGKNYNVSVAIKLNGVFGDYSTACDLFTAAPSRTVKLPFKASAYPNPFANNFMLDVTTSSKSVVGVKVYDMVGRLIEQRQVNASDIENTTIGDSYPSGIYNVVVSQEDSIETVRVIKR
ncbi:glycine-rich domain-containing protein [Flavobacterium sp. N1994]|uniref:glycine-rich domain-containing protein n=1 Tax=Flavobacterium sp. N1994 TaxID=2986827 RepID=UPI002221D53E|nr:T9SS type A sorting domain-containing protein [Flavobacterium sp. N1994]